MDKKLVREAKRGDPDSFTALIESCEQSMYKVAKAILGSEEDTSDAIQNSILVAWEKLMQLQREDLFKTWLIRIVINESNKIYRDRQLMCSEDSVPEAAEWESGYSSVEWRLFLEKLEEKYRTVTVLYYVEGWKVREIAEILELSQSAVKMRLAEARRRLAKLL